MTLCTLAVLSDLQNTPQSYNADTHSLYFYLFNFPQVCTLCPFPLVVQRWVQTNLIHQWAISDKQRATTCHYSEQAMMSLVTGMARAIPHKLSQVELSHSPCVCAPQNYRKRILPEEMFTEREPKVKLETIYLENEFQSISQEPASNIRKFCFSNQRALQCLDFQIKTCRTAPSPQDLTQRPLMWWDNRNANESWSTYLGARQPHHEQTTDTKASSWLLKTRGDTNGMSLVIMKSSTAQLCPYHKPLFFFSSKKGILIQADRVKASASGHLKC